MLAESAASHPSPELLRRFANGELIGPEADAVESHVAACARCCETLRGQGTDGFLDRVRAAGDAIAPAVVDRPAPQLEVPAALRDHPRYRVVELLGRGGMGAVYRAEHRVMQRSVALKIVKRTLTDRPDLVERFAAEVRMAARLAHPNIVQAFDAEEADGVHFLVMEYVTGIDLGRRLEHGPLTVGEACDYIRQAALGLQHAHEHGMTHRDVKPQNLMLAADGTVKVLDFGVARLAEENGAAGIGTDARMLLGSADYMAPEQADDPRAADIRSDIYALGCTLYHLLAGRVPFPRLTLTQKLRAHAEEAPPPLADVPAALAAVMARMMAKDPAQRYDAPAVVAAALLPFAARPAPPPPAHRQRRRLAAIAALLLLAAGLIAASVIFRIQTELGELVISVDNADVEVIVKQNGKVVEILDTKTKKRLSLAPGEYDLGLAKADGFKLDVPKVTIYRGREALATVERLPTPAPPKIVMEPQPAPPSVPPFDPAPGLLWYMGGLSGEIVKPALSPDGRYVAVPPNNPLAHGAVYDVAAQKELFQFPSGGLTSFTPDGKHLVASTRDGVQLYHMPTGAGHDPENDAHRDQSARGGGRAAPARPRRLRCHAVESAYRRTNGAALPCAVLLLPERPAADLPVARSHRGEHHRHRQSCQPGPHSRDARRRHPDDRPDRRSHLFPRQHHSAASRVLGPGHRQENPHVRPGCDLQHRCRDPRRPQHRRPAAVDQPYRRPGKVVGRGNGQGGAAAPD